MKTYIQIVVIFLTISTVVSCSEENFLDQTVTTDLDESTVFADSTYTTAFLTDIYTQIGFASDPDRFSNLFVTAGGLQTACDESELHTTSTITADLQFVTGTMNSISVTERPWNLPYANIRKVNRLLKNLPNTPLSDFRKERFEGEARFLRAWYYADLLKHYGGVPIVGDTIYTADDEIPALRNSYEETVGYIIAECDAAAQLLEVKPTGRQYGRAGAGACMALKSRVLLYAASPLYNGSSYADPYNELLGYPTADQERWKLAMEAAQAVINSGAYELYVDNETEPGFGFYAIFNAGSGSNDVNATPAEVTVGTILEKQATNDGAQLEQLFNPPSRNGLGGGGYPYQQTVEAFPMENGLNIDNPSSGYNPNSPYNNRDPRFYNSIVYDQAVLPQGTTDQAPVNIYLGSYNGQPSGQDAIYSGTPTGYYINKFRNRNISGNGGIGTNQNRPLIRYAEVLLNYAEARNEYVGPDDQVYQAIEAIRERAGLVPFELPSGLSQDEMREFIREERRVELMFEAHRFWDVRRWNIANETEDRMMKGMEITRDGNSVEFNEIDVRQHVFREAQYFWPIPYNEIAKSPELIQNPNY